MNWNRAFRLQSFAHYFSILCFLCLGFTSFYAHSEDLTRESCERKKRAGTLKSGSDIEKECREVLREIKPTGTGAAADPNLTEAERTKRKYDDQCSDALRDVRNKKDDYYKSCKDAGMGGSTCNEKVSTCERIGSEEEYSSNADLLRAFGTGLGLGAGANVASSCPKFSGQGFFERKDKLRNQLKDTNKELKDNKKEVADLKKDFTDQVKKIQEDIAEAQKEYQESQAKTKQGQRDRAAEQAKTAAEMAQNIRKLESAVLQKQQEKDNIYASKAQTLGQMTEDVSKLSCMDAVREAYQKRQATLKTGGQVGSSKSLIKSGKTSQNFLETTFRQCMARFYNERLNLMRTSDQKIETAEKDIRSAQSDMDNMKTQLSQMSSLEQQAQQDEQSTLTAQQQALQQKIQRATAELQSLQQTTQEKAAAIQEEQKSLADDVKSTSNQIVALGAEPADASTTGKMSDVSSSADAYKSAVRSARNIQNCEYKDDVFGESVSSTSTGRNKKPSSGSGTNKAAD